MSKLARKSYIMSFPTADSVLSMVLFHFLSSSKSRRQCVLLTRHLSSVSGLGGLEVRKSDDVGSLHSKGDSVCVCSDQ